MTAVGWKEGQPLPGSRDLPNNESLQRLFVDGLFSFLLPFVRLRYLLQVVWCANCWYTGLHLTADGYKIVYDVIMETIRTNWPDQDPEKLPMVFPGWADAPK